MAMDSIKSGWLVKMVPSTNLVGRLFDSKLQGL